jgi:hypothetical protein
MKCIQSVWCKKANLRRTSVNRTDGDRFRLFKALILTGVRTNYAFESLRSKILSILPLQICCKQMQHRCKLESRCWVKHLRTRLRCYRYLNSMLNRDFMSMSSQASSSRDTGAISSGFVRRREGEEDEDTVSRPAPAMRAALREHTEGDVNLETALGLRKAKGGDKVSQLLRMISENDSRPAGGGSLSAGARNLVNQVLRKS